MTMMYSSIRSSVHIQKFVQGRIRSTVRHTTRQTSSKPKTGAQKKNELKSKESSPSPSTSSTSTSSSDNNFMPLKSISIGAAAGLLGSLAGMGGGFIMIPMMTSSSIIGLTQHAAHGTSLFAVMTTGIAGGGSYFSSGHVDMISAASIAVSGMVSARLGAKFAGRLSQTQLKRALGAFMVCVAPIPSLKPYLTKMEKGTGGEGESEEVEVEGSSDGNFQKVAVSSSIGLFSGFMAGLFGVGGGAVVVPALTLFTSMDHYTALGTSLTAMGLPALVGTITHYQAGNVNMRVAPFLALGSIVGAYGGGLIGVKIDENYLRLGFSSLMLTLGLRTLIKI